MLTDFSHYNYVGLNVAVSASYVPGSGTPRARRQGPASGSTIRRMAITCSATTCPDLPRTASTSRVQQHAAVGNSVHGNLPGRNLGGQRPCRRGPYAPVPAGTGSFTATTFSSTQRNAQINLEGALNVEVAYRLSLGRRCRERLPETAPVAFIFVRAVIPRAAWSGALPSACSRTSSPTSATGPSSTAPRRTA